MNVVVVYLFNLVYLLLLVELVGDVVICVCVVDILCGIGMFFLIVRKEIDVYIVDCLLEVVWCEVLWLVKDGIVMIEEIDEFICMVFGICWVQMGLFEIYCIVGGEVGMKYFMVQFGLVLFWLWIKLMDVLEFNDELVDLIVGQLDV